MDAQPQSKVPMNDVGASRVNENQDVQERDELIRPGLVVELGKLPPDAVVTEAYIAQIFDRHPTSVKRAIERDELPPPCRLFGSNSWTVGAIVKHINTRLEEAASEAKRLNEKVTQLRP